MTAVQRITDSVLRIQRAHVNCYLVASDGGLTLVDAGLPGMWSDLSAGLAHFGATAADIDAIILTHGHFDHVGLCRRVIAEASDVTVAVHDRDRHLVRHPYRYAREVTPLAYTFWYPKVWGVLGSLAGAGALRVRGVDATASVEAGEELDVPGRPRAVSSPGHTNGHCAYLLEREGLLFSGDALVTFDPYTGKAGPRLVARAATADSDAALRSLEALGATDAGTVLPGHGAPFFEGARSAAARARRAGIS